MDASEKIHRRLNAKEVLITPKDGEFVFPVADGSAKIISKRLRIPRTHSETGIHRKERESLRESHGDREEFRPEETKDDQETFTIPLKYIDVIRSTHTDLDAAEEKRIDDHWNVDGNRNLSDTWTGFHKIYILERNSSEKDTCGPG